MRALRCGPPETDLARFVNTQGLTYKTSSTTILSSVIDYYSPAHLPVFNALAENFVLFDRWFASVPGPTNPNRAYLTSGTSAGHGSNDNAFTSYGLNQKSIFEQLSDASITWMNYQNTSFNPDAEFYAWTKSSGKSSTNVKVRVMGVTRMAVVGCGYCVTDAL